MLTKLADQATEPWEHRVTPFSVLVQLLSSFGVYNNRYTCASRLIVHCSQYCNTCCSVNARNTSVTLSASQVFYCQFCNYLRHAKDIVHIMSPMLKKKPLHIMFNSDLFHQTLTIAVEIRFESSNTFLSGAKYFCLNHHNVLYTGSEIHLPLIWPPFCCL